MKTIKIILKEIVIFFKNQIILVFFAIASLYVAIKCSHIKVFSWIPLTIQRLFIAPVEGTQLYECLNLLNGLCLAFLASFIFYIINNYIPRRINERKAEMSYSNEFFNLYSSMSRIIDMYLYEINIDKNEGKITLEDCKKMNQIKVTNCDNWIEIKYMNNGKFANTVSNHYNLLKDTIEETKRIYKNIDIIRSRSNYHYLSFSLVNCITKIEVNEFIKSMKFHYENPFISELNKGFSFLGVETSFYDLIQRHIELSSYVTNKCTYDFKYLNPERIENVKESETFMFARIFYKIYSVDYVINKINKIIQYSKTEERIEKARFVLEECIICVHDYYDTSSNFINSLMTLSDYITSSEFCNKIDIINKYHIKMYKGFLDEDTAMLKELFNDKDNLIKFYASILLKDTINSSNFYNQLSKKEKDIFINSSMYKLWEKR